jgi:Cys-tRNA(Pro)/Cys-tRNA(Cys) deacylase
MAAETRGTTALHKAGVPFAAHRYEHRTKGAAYAAEALGIDAGRLAKTLVASVDGRPVFALVPGDLTLDLKALARAAGAKAAALAEPREAERLTGYLIGGISPFGARRALPVFAERRYLEHERVALNGGARGLIVELARDDLVRLLQPTVTALTSSSPASS